MNAQKALNIVLGFMVILGFYAGHWFSASRAHFLFEHMNLFLNSDRNLEIVLNLKALEGLRGDRTEERIKVMEVRVEAALKYDGIKADTLAQAKEYQNKYCKTLCLGMQ